MKSLRIFHRFAHSGPEVRVRFAPSPTGELHIGGLRTALFNYLFAKKHGGSFILRIEDTDRSRLVDGAQNGIYNALYTYGLIPDEGPREGGTFGPYEQSKRLEGYEQAVGQLLETNHAYRCFCSEERLDLLRKDATRRGDIPKYDRRCANLDAETSLAMSKDKPYVVRFRLDKQDVSFEDKVFGVMTQSIDESDMVLLKSDGYPTYHLANVVDDRKMQISHVVRGMEWLSSTGKHIILYKAFGWQVPKLVHLSLIMRSATKKLSKRDKDAFVKWYSDELGALPASVINLLIRNGSGIRDFDGKKLYSLQEMVDNFDVSLLSRRNLLLDGDIFAKYAHLAFMEADFENLYQRIIDRIRKDLGENVTGIVTKEYVHKVVEFLRQNEESFAFLSSLTKGDFRWLFTVPKSADIILSNFTKNDILPILDELSQMRGFENVQLENVARRHGLSLPKVQALLRMSVIGSKKGPPISELISFFGVDECVDRISRMRNYVLVPAAESYF